MPTVQLESTPVALNPNDGFELNVTIIPNGADECALSASCSTDDGCSSTCSSACVST